LLYDLFSKTAKVLLDGTIKFSGIFSW